MYFSLKTSDSNFNITIDKPITLITGNSSTGKSCLIEEAKFRSDYTTDASNVYFEIDELRLRYAEPNSLFMIEAEYNSDKLLKDLKVLSSNLRDDICVVLIGRAYIRSLPLPIEAIEKLVTVKGITKNVPYKGGEL